MIVILIYWSLIGFSTQIFAAENEPVEPNQLIYLFSSGVEEYDFRAANWSRFAKASDQEFSVLLFDRGKTELIDLPEFVVEFISPHFHSKNTDYAILWSPFDGQVFFTGRGKKFEEILHARMTASLATDVDESTWGKIKELFQ
jgi:hypothetical protein